jgi:hypothetical protein
MDKLGNLIFRGLSDEEEEEDSGLEGGDLDEGFGDEEEEGADGEDV